MSAAIGMFPRVRNSRGKPAISVRATEVLLYQNQSHRAYYKFQTKKVRSPFLPLVGLHFSTYYIC